MLDLVASRDDQHAVPSAEYQVRTLAEVNERASPKEDHSILALVAGGFPFGARPSIPICGRTA
jgi:hypothetical protein